MEINCLHFDCLGSTNDWSKENYKDFDVKRITLVSADEQLGGRGRYQRKWLSPPNQNIYASFTFFIPKNQKNIVNMTQVAALSVVKTLKDFSFSPGLKWPNDILINQKKVAGLLSEIVTDINHLVVIIGIGININMPSELLSQINQPATSLLAEKGHLFQVTEVLQVLQKKISEDLDLFLHHGFSPFLKDYQDWVVHKKGEILELQQKKGIFQGIDPDGALVLKLPDGSDQKFYAGELIG